MEESTTKSKKKTPGIEESFSMLDEMVKKLESPDVTLEESFQTYQSGMKLIKKLGTAIDGYEKKIKKLSEDGSEEDLPEMDKA